VSGGDEWTPVRRRAEPHSLGAHRGDMVARVVCQKSIASSCGTPVVEFDRPAQWPAAPDRRVPVGRSHRLFSCGAAFTRIKIVGPALPAGAENDPTFNPTSSATACNVWGRLGTAKWRN
jgi:hypothetical protein